MFMCVNRQRREEGVTVTKGSFMHTTSLSISSYSQLVSEAGMLQVHAEGRQLAPCTHMQ